MSVIIKISDESRRQVEEALRAVPNGFPRAAAAALNKTSKTGKTRIVRRLGKLSGLKQKDVRRYVRVIYAKPERLTGGIRIEPGKGIPLYKFGAEVLAARAGVRVLFGPDGAGGMIYPHAFVATMPRSGHTGVFERRIIEGDLRSRRLPIDELRGPTILDVVESTPGIVQEEVRALGADLKKYMASQVDRLLHRRRIDRPEE